VAPELSDPVGPVEVGEHQDVEELGAGSGAERVDVRVARFGSDGCDAIVRIDRGTRWTGDFMRTVPDSGPFPESAYSCSQAISEGRTAGCTATTGMS
jgi:hypothetical protein